MEETTFTTERLAVRPWRADDVAWYLGAIDDEILRWTREDHVPTESEWLATHVNDEGDGRVRWAAIVSADEAVPVGSLGIERREGVIEIAYWIAVGERRRGFATEVVSGASAWAAEHHGLDRQELQIHPDNGASIAVAEACGFRFDRTEASCRSCAGADGLVAVYVRTVS